MTDSMKARRVTIHDRAADGKLTPLPDLALPDPPEMDCGGHGLYATVGEYMKFIRMILNDGAGPNGRVLKAETVAAMCAGRAGRDGAVERRLGYLDPLASSNKGEFFPGIAKGWAYTFMTNREATPSGRPAGSLMWAGLREQLLLDRPQERHRRLLGVADPAVPGFRVVSRLRRLRDRHLPPPARLTRSDRQARGAPSAPPGSPRGTISDCRKPALPGSAKCAHSAHRVRPRGAVPPSTPVKALSRSFRMPRTPKIFLAAAALALCAPLAQAQSRRRSRSA